jgi:glycosyltransferase involved in cell wall biosynthesis
MVTTQDPFETGLAGKCLVDLRKNSEFMIQVHTDLYSPYFASIYVGLKNAVLNRIRLFIARFTLPQADIVRVVNTKIADSLVARGFKNEEIIVKPIFVNVEKIKNTTPSFDLRQKYKQFQKIILMVSRLEPEKNIDMAIQAMKIVDNFAKIKSVNVGLVIVGSGGEMENLKSLVKRSNIENNVVFDGWQGDTVPYYKGADVYLMTSWYEGYGMTLVEAHAVGCAIVSTDVGVAREMNAHIVGWSPEDVGDGLNKILS